ncbi:hypothetical protein QL285_037050 [Trifolium repens]|nr:hypothetical protein QL285_037050 [Trifolium repens]
MIKGNKGLPPLSSLKSTEYTSRWEFYLWDSGKRGIWDWEFYSNPSVALDPSAVSKRSSPSVVSAAGQTFHRLTHSSAFNYSIFLCRSSEKELINRSSRSLGRFRR